ncbi:Fur family transcriptional regulator [Mammaliicoccus lentus]|uniref:Fur family transcriptional regulator n=1 Tax=Mammaliicoccus lentus TaxID=42858 RepID=UPI0035117C77
MKVEEAIQILKSEGHKYTNKRRDIISLFVNEDKYITAKYIQEALKDDYKGLSFDTIYRNLYLFKSLNIIESTEIDGEMKFRISCQDYHHHHFICESCGNTKVIDFCPMDVIKQQLGNVEITSHKLEVYGKCENCKTG